MRRGLGIRIRAKETRRKRQTLDSIVQANRTLNAAGSSLPCDEIAKHSAGGGDDDDDAAAATSSSSPSPSRKTSDRSLNSSSTAITTAPTPPRSERRRSRTCWNPSTSPNSVARPCRQSRDRKTTTSTSALDRQGTAVAAPPPSAAAELRAAALPIWEALVALVTSVFYFLGAVLQIFWRRVVKRNRTPRSGTGAQGQAAAGESASKTSSTSGGAPPEETAGGGSGGSTPTPRQQHPSVAPSDLGDDVGSSSVGDLSGDYPDDALEGGVGGDGSRVVRRGSLRPTYKDPPPVYKEPDAIVVRENGA
ncbi:hypothetical protein HPB50_003161 [Hyalomma asiaticum]|uniref:Uncharacterized protein n=1 Tax=Hyalomma asiaticum TaxID=266040 RepID=A0ACB7RUY5_HYAAI|nr:hypothetical protein HPB50_003161 [Hyalomma asiaticum]